MKIILFCQTIDGKTVDERKQIWHQFNPVTTQDFGNGPETLFQLDGYGSSICGWRASGRIELVGFDAERYIKMFQKATS